MKKYSRMLSIIMILAMIMTSSIFTVFAATGTEGAETFDVEFVEDGNEEPVVREAADSTAKNAAASFTVTFKDGDRTETVTVTAEEGATSVSYKLPSAEEVGFTAPEGKVFDKWDLGAAGTVITVENNDIVANAEWKDEVPPEPGDATGLTVNTVGSSVLLSWKAGKNADTYSVYLNGKRIATISGTKCSFTVNPYINNTFIVRAFTSYKDNGSTKWVPSKNYSNRVVWPAIRPMSITFKAKSSCTLKSHGGKKQTLKLRKGETVSATMFSGGKYIFSRNGSVFWMNRTRARKPVASYTTSFDYTREQAENFVNQYRIASNTRQMIWVSTYTQHAYYFTGSRGNWTCTRDWHVSTGKASTPTPTGKTYGTMKIQKKLKKRHSIPYWSCFSSFNAFHGKKKSWRMGAPASGGCVRNDVYNAEWIYNNVSKNSKAFVY